MRRLLLRWLAPFFLTGFFCLAPASAQQPELQRGANQLPAVEGQEANEHNPAPAYMVAVLLAFGTLVVLCMPSRKG